MEFHMFIKIIGLLEAEHSAAKIYTLFRLLKVNERHVYHVKNFMKRQADIVRDQSKDSQNSKRSPSIFCDGVVGSVMEWDYFDLFLHARS